MINMLKVLIFLFIIIMLIAWALLGKKTLNFFTFRTAQTKRRETEWILWIMAAIIVIVSIFGFVQNKTPPSALKVFGAYIFLTGGIIQIVAKRQCKAKTQCDAMKENFHAATEYGIYHKLRHPSKTGLFLMIMGIAMTLQSGWGITIGLLLFLPALLWRISQEENTLMDEFGDRYYLYQEHSNKLIPFVI